MHRQNSQITYQTSPEHRLTTFDCFVWPRLDHIPMLDQNAILEANDVRSNQLTGYRSLEPSSDDKITFSHDRSGFIFESRRKALDEIEHLRDWDHRGRCGVALRGDHNFSAAT